MSNNPLAPVLFLPHGGGPLPLLGDPAHSSLTAFLSSVPQQFPRPDAILMVSAHWESTRVVITGSQQPDLIYDYSGFPPASYEIQYPAPGAPELAMQVQERFIDHGIDSQIDSHRGFDHGMFVPLKLMYPDAAIPCIQISLVSSLDPAVHVAIGKALVSLRKHNILVIGSGMSYHNLSKFFTNEVEVTDQSEQFDDWLTDTCCDAKWTTKQRHSRISDWQSAPAARACHPREEHLLPLHVCLGMAADSGPARRVYSDYLAGKKISAYLW